MIPYDSPYYLAIKEFWAEPDFWESEQEGYKLFARRNSMKSWCGYAKLPAGHPFEGAAYRQNFVVPKAVAESLRLGENSPISVLGNLDKPEGIFSLDLLVEVHGGVTWADNHRPGGPVDGWWLGFDCSHAGDLSPKDAFWGACAEEKYPWWLTKGDEYRSLEYMQKELVRMVEDLKRWADAGLQKAPDEKDSWDA